MNKLKNRKQEIEKEIELLKDERLSLRKIGAEGQVFTPNNHLYTIEYFKEQELELINYAIDIQNKRDAEMFKRLKEFIISRHRTNELNKNNPRMDWYNTLEHELSNIIFSIDKIQEEFKDG